MYETKFKQTDIGGIPAGWKVVPLDSLATPLMGQSPPSQHVVSEKSDNSLPFYQGNSEFNDKYLGVPKAYCNEPTRIAEAKSVLISVRAPVGAVNITKEKISIGRGLAALSCTSCNHDFLFYYLLSNESRWERIKQGSTFESVNKKDIHNFLIATPELKEQSDIASVLACTDMAIQQTDEVIAHAKAVKKGLMQELLTKGIGHKRFKETVIGEIPEDWEVQELGSIGEVITGKTPPTNDAAFWGGKVPFVTPTDIGEKKFQVSTGRKVTEDGLQEVNEIPPSCLMVTCIASIGKNAISTERSCTNQQINTIKPNDDIDVEYLYYYIEKIKPRLEVLSGKTSVPILNKTEFEHVLVAKPKKEEQIRLAKIMSSVDARIESELNKRYKLEVLKKGLMQDLLTGRVRFPEFVKGAKNA